MLKPYMAACLLGTALVTVPAFAQSERKTPPPAGSEGVKPAEDDAARTSKPAPQSGGMTSSKPAPASGANLDGKEKARADGDEKSAAKMRSPAPPSGSSAVSYITQNRSGLWRASKLKDVDVYNENNEKIGEIEEILLDKDGKVEAVVIGVGGFLGIGERDVAVPFSAIQWRMSDADVATPNMPAATPRDAAPRDRDAVVARRTEKLVGKAGQRTKDGPERAILAGATKDMLKKAPQFKYAD